MVCFQSDTMYHDSDNRLMLLKTGGLTLQSADTVAYHNIPTYLTESLRKNAEWSFEISISYTLDCTQLSQSSQREKKSNPTDRSNYWAQIMSEISY